MTNVHDDPLYRAVCDALRALPVEKGAAAAAKRLAAFDDRPEPAGPAVATASGRPRRQKS